jgi:hypothetical protein
MNDENFLVLTLTRPGNVENIVHRLKSSIASLPGGPVIPRIRRLNRRLQSLSGWGDAAAAAETGGTRGTEDLALCMAAAPNCSAAVLRPGLHQVAGRGKACVDPAGAR